MGDELDWPAFHDTLTRSTQVSDSIETGTSLLNP